MANSQTSIFFRVFGVRIPLFLPLTPLLVRITALGVMFTIVVIDAPHWSRGTSHVLVFLRSGFLWQSVPLHCQGACRATLREKVALDPHDPPWISRLSRMGCTRVRAHCRRGYWHDSVSYT